MTSSDHVPNSHFFFFFCNNGGYTLSKKGCFAHFRPRKLNNDLINNQKMWVLFLIFRAGKCFFRLTKRWFGERWRVTFMVVIFRTDAIRSQMSGNYDYSDEGSQALQFDWVTFTINQPENTKMSEGGKINLVDKLTLKIGILLPGNIENIIFLMFVSFRLVH